MHVRLFFEKMCAVRFLAQSKQDYFSVAKEGIYSTCNEVAGPRLFSLDESSDRGRQAASLA